MGCDRKVGQSAATRAAYPTLRAQISYLFGRVASLYSDTLATSLDALQHRGPAWEAVRQANASHLLQVRVGRQYVTNASYLLQVRAGCGASRWPLTGLGKGAWGGTPMACLHPLFRHWGISYGHWPAMPRLSLLAVIIYIIPVAAFLSPNQPIVATAVLNASVHVDFAKT